MAKDARRKTIDSVSDTLVAKGSISSNLGLKGYVKITCYDADGNLKWEEDGPNLVTNEGEAHFLDVGVHNATQITAWSVGLLGSVTGAAGTLAEGDTLGSWGTGISEFTTYSEGTREAYLEGAVTTGATPSVDNTTTPASFSISGAGGTVGGAFLASTSTKGGTAGILLAEKAFTGGDRSLNSGDTLNIEYTLTASGS